MSFRDAMFLANLVVFQRVGTEYEQIETEIRETTYDRNGYSEE